MKKIFLLTFIMLAALNTNAQQKLSYVYDAAGNRISRTIVLGARSADATTSQTDSVFFEEMLAEKQIKIYPNPVEFELTISIDGYEPAMRGEYSLFTITGAMLLRNRISGTTTYVDMSRYSKGTYILNIQLNGQPTSWKIIKQ